MNDLHQIVYYAGCTANLLEPEIGISTIQFLEENGFETILPQTKCCGLPYMANGRIDAFRKLAIDNISSFQKVKGEILTTCTSCTLMLKRDYPELIGGAAAKEVAERTIDIIDFIAREKMLDCLIDSSVTSASPPIRGVYHAPCHLKAAGNGAIEKRIDLFNRIPGLEVEQIDRGCCGMGGTYGIKGNTFSNSIEIGSYLFNDINESKSDIVITDCPACKMQLEQGTDKEIVHPISLIGKAIEAQKKRFKRQVC